MLKNEIILFYASKKLKKFMKFPGLQNDRHKRSATKKGLTTSGYEAFIII